MDRVAPFSEAPKITRLSLSTARAEQSSQQNHGKTSATNIHATCSICSCLPGDRRPILCLDRLPHLPTRRSVSYRLDVLPLHHITHASTPPSFTRTAQIAASQACWIRCPPLQRGQLRRQRLLPSIWRYRRCLYTFTKSLVRLFSTIWYRRGCRRGYLRSCRATIEHLTRAQGSTGTSMWSRLCSRCWCAVWLPMS